MSPRPSTSKKLWPSLPKRRLASFWKRSSYPWNQCRKSAWNPPAVAAFGSDHSETMKRPGYSRSISSRSSFQNFEVSLPSSFFTSEPAMSARKPSAPMSSQKRSMFFNSSLSASTSG